MQRLALLSLSSIFKDILPGYRIRDLTEEERAVKVTKAVQKLRDYEHALLRGFESYVKVLRSMLAPRKHPLNTQRCARRPPILLACTAVPPPGISAAGLCAVGMGNRACMFVVWRRFEVLKRAADDCEASSCFCHCVADECSTQWRAQPNKPKP